MAGSLANGLGRRDIFRVTGGICCAEFVEDSDEAEELICVVGRTLNLRFDCAAAGGGTSKDEYGGGCGLLDNACGIRDERRLLGKLLILGNIDPLRLNDGLYVSYDLGSGVGSKTPKIDGVRLAVPSFLLGLPSSNAACV